MIGKKLARTLARLAPEQWRADARDFLHWRKKRAASQARVPQPAVNKVPPCTWSREAAVRAEQNPKPVRLAFAGAGNYAKHHLAALAALPGVQLSLFLSTGSERSRAAIEEFKPARVTQDPEEFAAAKDVDAFFLVVPPEPMFALASRCLASGRPVFVEKPPGISSLQTSRLIEIADAAKTFGMVGMNRRFYSCLQHGLASLASCGPIRGLSMYIPQEITRDRQQGRLTAFDYEHYHIRNSIHSIDLARFLLGEPEEVLSIANPNDERGNAAASFASTIRFENGSVATSLELWDTPQRWDLRLVAELGWLEMAPLETARFQSRGGPPIQVEIDPVDRQFRSGLYAQDWEFLQAVRRNRLPAFPSASLQDALGSMRLAEAIRAGFRGKLRDFVPAPDTVRH